MPSKGGGLVGHESDLEKAISGSKLSDAPLKVLDQLFRRCMIKVGIRAANLPSKEETIILYDHVVKHYGGHTLEEIDLAFEMAITGKLETDPNPYENFSCTYISRIINSYRIWAGQAIEHIRKDKQEVIQYSGPDWRGLIQFDYESFLNNRCTHQLWPVAYYDQLVDDGFIYPYLYKELMDKARVDLCSEVQFKITVEKDPLKAELEEYNSTHDLEKALLEYRTGKRDVEVVLLAKQRCVLMLFKQAKGNGYKLLYKNHD